MSTSFFREYRVHHSSPEGVVVQLPGNKGFGRFTKDSLGGDALAERLLKNFSARETVPGVLRRTRDAQGFRLLTVNLSEAWSELLTYPAPIRQLVPQLLRKHLLVGLGTTTLGRLVKSSRKGSVLTIPPNMTAVATLEMISGTGTATNEAATSTVTTSSSSSGVGVGGDAAASATSVSAVAGPTSVEVRLLNYDVANHVANVTAKTEVIESTPMDTAVAATALASLRPGSKVRARVLLSCTDDDCAVVEVSLPVTGSGSASAMPCSVLGYYLFKFTGEKSGATATSPSVGQPPVVGSTVELTIEFVAEHPALQELLPFVVLSRRDSFATLPLVRQPMTERPSTGRAMSASSSSTSSTSLGMASFATGLLGYLPWRDVARRRFKDYDSEDDDDENGHDGHDASGEPKLRRRKLEETIDAYERAMEHAVPTSPEEFQRLLLAQPNSSFLWTQYMAFHVGLQQYEEARQVAEKALSTIGVREQEERLNVWVAYLNVENLYGTAESLASIFKRALRHQLEPLILHERLADIFAASRKSNQLLALCRTMTSKFRNERRPWERLGIVLVDQDKRDQLKRMIKDMSDALKRDDATLVVVHIAIHEFKQGSVENGRALFEGLLAKTPRKSDVWSAYVDQELALLNRRAPESSATHVRNVFERAVAMNFSAKVMQQFLTRFMAFEKAFGAPSDVEKVKERARAYVESKIHAVTETGVA